MKSLEVLATLCNLSLCGCIGENPLQFLKAMQIESLVSFLCSADTTYRLFGAVTLGNIASDLGLQVTRALQMRPRARRGTCF